MAKVLEPRFDITNRITANLTRIERARGFLEAATLSADWVRKMGARAGAGGRITQPTSRARG